MFSHPTKFSVVVSWPSILISSASLPWYRINYSSTTPRMLRHPSTIRHFQCWFLSYKISEFEHDTTKDEIENVLEFFFSLGFKSKMAAERLAVTVPVSLFINADLNPYLGTQKSETRVHITYSFLCLIWERKFCKRFAMNEDRRTKTWYEFMSRYFVWARVRTRVSIHKEKDMNQ
jgi:hypothetical protein